MKLPGLAILFALILFTLGCTSASKSFQKGRYDDAIVKSIHVLQKTPSDEKHRDILKDAYRVANLNDEEQVALLKQSGQPEIWGNIVTIYERMIERNKKVETLPSSVKNEIGFSYQSYTDDLLTAKRKAADYFYASGEQKLNKKTQIDARNAYADFEKVIHYAGTGYRDVEARKEEARELGTAYVLYKLDNRSGRVLPREAVYNLGNIQPEQLSSFWVKYEVPISTVDPGQYHYHATFTLERYEFFPPTIKTKQNSYSKTITDGTEYLTDSRGKPILDSAGNFIKVPKKLNLTCNVVEVIQEKGVRLSGNLAYFDVANKRYIRTLPLQQEVFIGTSTFDIKGDTRALSENERKRVSTPPIPLPPDEELLILATQHLGEKIHHEMNHNTGLLR